MTTREDEIDRISERIGKLTAATKNIDSGSFPTIESGGKRFVVIAAPDFKKFLDETIASKDAA